MELKDVTIGALGGVVTMFGPLIGLLIKILRMYIRQEMSTELEVRMSKYEERLERRMTLIIRAELAGKSPSDSGISGVFLENGRG